jgi:NADH-quinone oxidoreductase subunit F
LAALGEYLQNGGYEMARRALAMPRDPATNSVPALIEAVKKSGLRGRGGAGFSTGLKWSFVDFRSQKPRYLAVNADESEPGTFKDRAVLGGNPHLLLEGILIACHACGIERAYIYIRGEYVLEFERLVAACAEAYRAGVLGRNALGSPHTFHVTPHRGAGAYICGEETGLLSSLEGDRGYPKIKPPYPTAQGAWRCPTVVNNAGTLALLPSILRLGPENWVKIGIAESAGPMVYCLSGHVKRPGLYEAPMTVTLRELIHDFGGGVLDDLPLKAVIPGGSSMPVLKFDGPYRDSTGRERRDELGLRMDFESVRAAGSLLGSAGVIVMHARTCMVKALHNLVRFYHHESCGQCTPCREGTGWLEKVLARIIRGKGRPADVQTLLSLAGQMSGATICLLSDSCAMPVGSFVTKFREEFEYYCANGKSMVADPIEML